MCNRTRDYVHVKPTYSIAFATHHALKWHGSNCHKVTRMNICTFHLHFSQIAFRNRRVSSFLNICTAKQWGYKNRRVGRWRHTSGMASLKYFWWPFCSEQLHCRHYLIASSLFYYINSHCYKFATSHKKIAPMLPT